MFTGKDFENMGKAAANEYVSDNKPLNTSITKIAEHYGLNTAQVARVVEQANVETYLKLNNASENKYTEFDPANSEKIASSLKFNVEKTAALNSDYDDIIPPEEFEIISGMSDNEIEALEKSDELFVKRAFKHINAALESRLEEVDESFSRESTTLYNLVKQAALETGQFDLVKQAMVTAVPDASTALIADAYAVKLKKEAARVNFDEVAPVKGMLNNEHPVVKSLVKMAILKEEYLTLKSLQKEAAGPTGRSLGRLLKSLGQTGKATAEVAGETAKGIASGVLRHKALAASGITGIAGIQLGKAKGRTMASKANVRFSKAYVERGKNLKPL
ncbi:MAG: hypothetical protein H8D23_12060 [Candidatus Brocadiales bacterium]|nr:hypothetical protein [Candidatus Brocadiales bacterium]